MTGTRVVLKRAAAEVRHRHDRSGVDPVFSGAGDTRIGPYLVADGTAAAVATAVSIDAHVARRVVKIPNAALRFRPNGDNEPLAEGLGKVFVLTPRGEDHLEAKTIPIGITDGAFTEARGELAAGVRVVTDELESGDKKKGKAF